MGARAGGRSGPTRQITAKNAKTALELVLQNHAGGASNDTFQAGHESAQDRVGAWPDEPPVVAQLAGRRWPRRGLLGRRDELLHPRRLDGRLAAGGAGRADRRADPRQALGGWPLHPGHLRGRRRGGAGGEPGRCPGAASRRPPRRGAARALPAGGRDPDAEAHRQRGADPRGAPLAWQQLQGAGRGLAGGPDQRAPLPDHRGADPAPRPHREGRARWPGNTPDRRGLLQAPAPRVLRRPVDLRDALR